jgi:FkbM family methyltransferase
VRFNHKPVGIIHVGACDLEEAEYYRSLGDPVVLWVEARSVFKKAHWNHTVMQAAFSDKSEVATFHVTDNLYSSSLLPLQYHPGVTEIAQLPIWTVRADECLRYLAAFSPEHFDTLVLDVQGAELKVLRGFGKLLGGFDWIMCEVFYDEVYENVPTCGEVVVFLEKKGFEVVGEEKHSSGLWGDILVKRAKL